MLLSAHQPAYMPWPGYLDKIRKADVFVVLDTVERSHGDWSNRNRIKTQNGELMLTVPLKGSRNARFCEVLTDESKNWRKKHRRSVEQAYGKTSDVLLPDGYSDQFDVLTWFQLNEFCWAFEIDTPKYPASRLGVEGAGNDLILALCRYFDADEFLFGAQGRDYADVDYLYRNGVTARFQNYVQKPYPQAHGDFIPGLSALDLLLNCGEGAKDFL